MNLKDLPVTHWLLIVLVAAFVVQMAAEAALPPVEVRTPAGSFQVNQIDWNFALWPGRVLQGDALVGVFTNMFLHSTHLIMHIFFNAWAIYMFGLFLERRIGGKNLLKLFLVSGLIGSVAHIAFASLFYEAGLVGYALGASGGVFGILGALVVLEPNVKVIMLPVPVPLELWKAVTFFVVLMTFLFAFGGLGGIAHDVHMAGLAVGLLMGFKLKKAMAAEPDFTWRAVYAPKDDYSWIDEYR